jgi:hypothetical protein
MSTIVEASIDAIRSSTEDAVLECEAGTKQALRILAGADCKSDLLRAAEQLSEAADALAIAAQGLEGVAEELEEAGQ